jgi:hypothetical protein
MGGTVRDEQEAVQKDDNDISSLSPRAQRIIEHLQEQWQHSHEPSPDRLKRITEFVVSLPEAYRTAGLTALGDHIASNLILHFLDTMALFGEKAEQEGISVEEREGYIHYVLTELFSSIVGINRNISIQSLDELTALTAITVNLQGLSHADTAEEAQSWMYELPKIYLDELRREHLLKNKDQVSEVEASETAKSPKFTDWKSYSPHQGYVISGPGVAQATIPWESSPPKIVPFSQKQKLQQYKAG